MSMRSLRGVLTAAGLLLAGVTPCAAADPAALDIPGLDLPGLDLPGRADGAVVVPDRFLRRWDPVTVFFDRDAGPASGPEDTPERLVRLSPEHPGAWTWIGPRALQFRPAEAWQPLRRVTVSAGGQDTTLVPLLPRPLETAPTDQDNGVAELDTFSLTFADPVDLAALSRLLTIELRPLLGLDATGAESVPPDDVTILPMERADRAAKQTYLIRLRRPVPDARVAVLRLRLSDAAGLDDPIFEMRLRSATAFKLQDSYCGPDYGHDTQDGVVRCLVNGDAGPRTGLPEFDLNFTENPQPLDVMQARQAIRLTPPVPDLALLPSKDGRDYRLAGHFLPDTVYRVEIAPGAVADRRGRPLAAKVDVRFVFRAEPPRLRWDAAQGLVERLGPQMVPLRGHGYDRADLRIHRIDPLARDFWPFPRTDGPTTRDDDAPPLPGNEPEAWSGADSVTADDMARRLKALGSPPVSEIVDLAIRRGGVDAKFGLDLKPFLARIAGADQAGAYLVGLRPLQGMQRSWMRIQVTDLAVTAVEEPGRVRFSVTSLGTAQPVAGAAIRLEGTRQTRVGEQEFTTLAQGVTDADGTWLFPARVAATADTKRVVVVKGADTLVLNAAGGPPQYGAAGWTQPRGPWLTWPFVRDALVERQERPRTLCHVFTERPIYRPEEAAEIRGFVRTYLAGTLRPSSERGTLLVHGPDDQEWRYPLTLDATSGFHHRFDAPTAATGEYSAEWVTDGGERCGSAPFKKEAYRLPTFEVLANAPQRVPLDAPFTVDLLARYYAGGLVSDRPLHWRVQQFPYAWTPPGRDGFLFSSDSRFSGDDRFRSTPVLARDVKLDAGGAAQLVLDPSAEPTAQPRRYDIEATVTGDDDQQVRTVAHVQVLPPFVLGLKVPRYLPEPGAIEPEILAVDADGKPLAGIALQVKLVHRNWNAVLQASDFAGGSAKYVTQQMDRTVEDRRVVSTADVQRLRFDTAVAGVYVLEASAEDRTGRRQTVRVDLFMAGGTPVTWARAPSRDLAVTTDKDDYVPGETATLLVQSPFQTARALVVQEVPGGQFDYSWTDIRDGVGRVAVTVRPDQMPRLAVHVLVMRGRLPGTAPAATAPFDLGKPTTVAATAWVKVRPVKNQVTVGIEAPASARPAQTVDIALRLADDLGRPISGEATFWMVDQAVLALAREAPLDPLPKFIVDRPVRAVTRDTRNMAFGIIPLRETPGGDAADDEHGMENISVRKNFTPVPVYLPRVRVGPDGIARFQVKLPDTLTVFMLRAVVTSGTDRFGYATGQMRVRQPVIAQPLLPRFVRPADRFTAGVLGRLVEGAAGPGTASIGGEGVTVDGGREQGITWDAQRPTRTGFDVTVPPPAPGASQVRIRMLVRRQQDGIGDAVQVDLPIRPDRPVVRRRVLATLAPGATLDLAPPGAAARVGSYSASVSVAADPALLRVVGALDHLVASQARGTEQQIALATAELALKPFAAIAGSVGLEARIVNDVGQAIRAVSQGLDENGLVALFPRMPGRVWLTATAYDLLVRAEKAGLPGNPALRDRLATVLTQALRSDYAHLFAGEALLERTLALWALQQGGKADPAYTAELARRGTTLPTTGLALVIAAIRDQQGAESPLLPPLLDILWSRVQILARDGQPTYASLSGIDGNPLILPSEARSLAETVRAVTLTVPQDRRLPVLRTALVGLGGADGWGSTNADAAAIRALATGWGSDATSPITMTMPEGERRGTLDRTTPLLRWTTSQARPIRVRSNATQPVLALHETRYVPTEPGALAAADQAGFAVSRSLFRVPSGGSPLERLQPTDGAIRLAVGDIVEELAEVVTPVDRSLVAISLPLAAGLELLNPNLATAPAEAAPTAGPTRAPSYAAFGDDAVTYVYETLPKGSYQFRFRTRAVTPGSFTQPPGEAQMLYRDTVYGASDGARVAIGR